MASPTLDNFNAFIDAEKAWVDTLSITATRKTEIKARLETYKVKGEDFYARVVKEYTRHLRKHIAAAKAGGGNAALCDQLDAIATNQDAEANHVIVAYAKAL